MESEIFDENSAAIGYTVAMTKVEYLMENFEGNGLVLFLKMMVNEHKKHTDETYWNSLKESAKENKASM